MDRRERFGDLPTSLLAALSGWQAGMWTALPGVVSKFDASANTCEVKPSILGTVKQPDGTFKRVSMPMLLDVPVVWQGGGGATLTFPIKAGDECLVVFASRCIDAWWQLGADPDPNVVGRPQLDFRMHDLSDGFALVGLRSLPRAFPVSTSAAQLRSDDGSAYVGLNPTTHEIDIVTSGNAKVQAGGTATVTATHVVLHASGSMAQDVGGYGQKISNDGSGNITIDTYYTGAVVTTNAHNYNPPEIPT